LHNPVALHFGKGVVSGLGKAASELGKRALVVYGKGSVKSNGSYDATIKSLKKSGVDIVEYSGIKSNPIIEDVDRAAIIARQSHCDLVVAIGGGSVIDSAKVISITIPVEHTGWDFVTGAKKPDNAVPLIGVLTLAATGTEMNPVAVIQHDGLKQKIGFGNKLMYPKHSFLDPTYTISVSANYTAYGIVDLIAHSLEVWFGAGDASLSDRFIVAIIKEAMKYGPELINNLEDYSLRARIMYAATCALNGMTLPGRKSGDWGVHDIGHNISVLWDVAHGASLSIAYPAWLKLQKERIPERITALGTALFNCENASDTIYRLEHFFKLLGSPIRLSEAVNNSDKSFTDKLSDLMIRNKVNGVSHKLSEEDLRTIARFML